MGIKRIEKAIHWWTKARTRVYTLLLATQFKEIGRGARITPPLRFWGLDQMILGEEVMINRDCWIHIVGGYGDPETAKIVIKCHAGIGMGAHIAAAKKVVIGEYALLGRNVHISDHLHAYSDVSRPIMEQGFDGIRPVCIGRETWLGNNVVVLAGVSIGEHCVIGANSVVNSCIPDFSVAVGSPARVVKRYRPETKQWMRV